MVPHLGKTVSPKGHKESAIRKKIKTLFNPLLLQSNIQVNFEMFYQKYAFDIKLKAYPIHYCFGLTTDVFSMHLICNCIAIKRVLWPESSKIVEYQSSIFLWHVMRID